MRLPTKQELLNICNNNDIIAYKIENDPDSIGSIIKVKSNNIEEFLSNMKAVNAKIVFYKIKTVDSDLNSIDDLQSIANMEEVQELCKLCHIDNLNTVIELAKLTYGRTLSIRLIYIYGNCTIYSDFEDEDATMANDKIEEILNKINDQIGD